MDEISLKSPGPGWFGGWVGGLSWLIGNLQLVLVFFRNPNYTEI